MAVARALYGKLCIQDDLYTGLYSYNTFMDVIPTEDSRKLNLLVFLLLGRHTMTTVTLFCCCCFGGLFVCFGWCLFLFLFCLVIETWTEG